jgi:hypothetical protein
MATGPRSSPRLASWREPSIPLWNYLEGLVTLSALVAVNAAIASPMAMPSFEKGRLMVMRSQDLTARSLQLPHPRIFHVDTNAWSPTSSLVTSRQAFRSGRNRRGAHKSAEPIADICF